MLQNSTSESYQSHCEAGFHTHRVAKAGREKKKHTLLQMPCICITSSQVPCILCIYIYIYLYNLCSQVKLRKDKLTSFDVHV